MESISAYARRLLAGDNTVLPHILMCVEGQNAVRSDDCDVQLFPHLIKMLLKEGHRMILASSEGVERVVPPEECVLALRILQTGIARGGESCMEARKALIDAGVGACRAMNLDRYFGLQQWIIPHIARFVVSLGYLFRLPTADILSIQANVQLVDQIAGRNAVLTAVAMELPREATNNTATSAAHSPNMRRYRELPRKPTFAPPACNPLHNANGVNIWMSPQFPTPVLTLAKRFGLGCESKLPRAAVDIIPSTFVPKVNNKNDASDADGSDDDKNENHVRKGKDNVCDRNDENGSKRLSRRLDAALYFDHQWSSLFRRYLTGGVMIIWGNWKSLSGNESFPSSSNASQEEALSPCVFQPLITIPPVPVVATACGAQSCYFVTFDSQIHSCGCNQWGQLGSENWKNTSISAEGFDVSWRSFRVPTRRGDDITTIVAGAAFALAVSRQNLYLWGQNLYGQCLSGDLNIVPNPISVTLPERFGEVVDVTCGCYFAAMAFKDGRLGTWGIASMLGVPMPPGRLRETETPDRTKCATNITVFQPPTSRIRMLRAGPWHCLAITEEGQVYSWGFGRDGRLGHGDDRNLEKMRLIDSLSRYTVVNASCGTFHSAVITKEGQVFVFGANSCNQLGLKGRASRLFPEHLFLPRRAIDVSCGREHTCILLEDGDLMSCGTLRGSGIGYGYGARILIPCRILQSYLVLSVVCGAMHAMTLGVLRPLTLQLIGSSTGVPRRETVDWVNQIMVRKGVRSVAAGKGFMVLITENGDALSMGQSLRGQLGNGDLSSHDHTSFQYVKIGKQKLAAVSCGLDFVLCITTDGGVLSWGWNSHGQLGQGSDVPIQNSLSTPRKIMSLGVLNIVQVACGGTFALALTQDGVVYTWGEGRFCGRGETSVCVTVPTILEELQHVVSVAAGISHAVVLTYNNIIYAWGRGPLGNGGNQSQVAFYPTTITFPHSVRQLGCGPFNTYAIIDNGDLFVWGLNDKFQCGVRQNGSEFDDGKDHSVILFPTLGECNVRNAAFSLTCGMVILEDGSTALTGHFTHYGKDAVVRFFTPQAPFESVESDDTKQDASEAVNSFFSRCFSGYDVLFSVLEWRRPKAAAVAEAISELSQCRSPRTTESKPGC